ncbi:hypothetical protein CICLE_v10029952mg [Citrus x clementina]|uniref:Dehydrin n=1 Tax=Citrus clementina TaxID=85681 RepID=V4U906_CITCL|nr:hypothetical protein CICLE_v10029952mg [Citrus x clementina]
MADHQQQGNEAKGCGMFDFLKNKNEEKSQDAAMVDVETKEEKPAFSSEEEIEGADGEKKRKKKKGLKEKIQEKISSEKEENAVEKNDEIASAEATHLEEKKGFLEKIKDKLPGQHKKAEEGAACAGCCPNEHLAEGDEKEKKGILEKIKEKLPGYHSEDEKAKHKDN